MLGQNPSRVLALHATTRGFAYCIFDGPGHLIDWGIKHVRAGQKNQNCLVIIQHLLSRFDPHTVVIEDLGEIGGRRSLRVRHLYCDIEKLADRANLNMYCYPWQMVFSVFSSGQPKTRHDLAVMIAEMLPAISKRLPPKRKAWLPMDPRQALFDAAALGLTCYSVND